MLELEGQTVDLNLRLQLLRFTNSSQELLELGLGLSSRQYQPGALVAGLDRSDSDPAIVPVAAARSLQGPGSRHRDCPP